MGDPCTINLDCGYDPTLNCVAGVCVPTPDRGEPCDDLEDCRVSLGCHEGICEDVACFVDLGGFCASSGKCATDSAYCDDTGHCSKLPTEGESCNNRYSECAADLYCDPSTHHCLRLPALRPIGSPCTITDTPGYSPLQCQLDSFCQHDETSNCLDCGTCTPFPGVEGCR